MVHVLCRPSLTRVSTHTTHGDATFQDCGYVHGSHAARHDDCASVYAFQKMLSRQSGDLATHLKTGQAWLATSHRASLDARTMLGLPESPSEGLCALAHTPPSFPHAADGPFKVLQALPLTVTMSIVSLRVLNMKLITVFPVLAIAPVYVWTDLP